VRRHTKATPTGSTSAGSPLGPVRCAATPGVSPASGESGAPSARGVVGFLLALALLALTPASASAITTRPALGSSPITGSGTGVTIHRPSGMAVNEANGNLFLNDGTGSGNVVDIFGAEGGVPTGLVSPYQLTGVTFYFEPSGAAFDNSATSPSKGTLYVGNSSPPFKLWKFVRNGGTEKYELAGDLPPTSGPSYNYLLGVATDTKGNVYAADYGSSSVVKFSPTGTQLARIDVSASVGRPSAIALDAAGDLFVQGYYHGGVYKYPANGLGEIEPAVFSQVVSTGATGVAVDTSANTLFVGLGNHVNEYDATTLAPAHEFGYGVLSESDRIAVNSTTGRVYVADNNFSKNNVAVFGGLVTTPDATVTIEPPGTITGTTAVLNAKIDDNGALPTFWQFEISKNGTTWTKAGSKGSTAGNQSGSQITATATGLTHKTKYFYRVVATKGGPADAVTTDGTANFTTATIPNATVALEPAENVTSNSAKLSAKVTDNGPLPTSWRFEYSSDEGSTWKPVNTGTTAGGQIEVPVTGTATGLTANTEYRFRLVTSKGAGSDGEVPSIQRTFTTVAVPPVVSDVGAIEIEDTSVRFVGTVDPGHSPTAYVFEYGTTPGLGSSTAPVDIGDSSTPLIISQVAPNLSPSTKYYFKLKATNLVGQVTSETQTVTTRANPLPNPDHRAYELVSPPFKNYSDADFGGATLGLSGEGAAFRAFGSFGNPPGQLVFFWSEYNSKRTETGWQSGASNPQVCPFDSNSPFSYGYAFQFETVRYDANIEHGVARVAESESCEIEPLNSAAPLPATNLYKENFSTDPFHLSDFELLAPHRNYDFGYGQSYLNGTASFEGGSPDFSHVVFSSGGQQTPDTPPQGPGSSYVSRLYDWHDGTLSLISKEPLTDNLFTEETDLASTRPGSGAISDDGNRIFFGSPGIFSSNRELFMRENDTTTYRISRSECTSSCGSPAKSEFAEATPDGSKALFASTAKLSDEDNQPGRDLYMFTQSPEPEDPGEQNLTLIDKDNEPADGTEGTFRGVYGMSNDGNTVFFVSTSQLVFGKPTAPGPKLYRWQWNEGSPTIEYLATLSFSEENGRWGDFGSPFRTKYQVTPSGNDLVIATEVPLIPIADRDSSTDVYRWDAQQGWSCVSCQFPGVPSTGPSTTGRGEGLQISDDGKRIPFQTTDALLPADVNGESGCAESGLNGIPACQDVYEWNDGALSLVSTGISTDSSNLYGISRSGRDILFSTRERLVGWDTDTNRDIYDARIGGGFPEPPVAGAPCEGEACRLAGTSPPTGPGSGTSVFEGAENKTEPASCPKGFRKATVNGESVCKKKKTHKRHGKRHHRRAGANRRAGK
jgi:hypothetical protein